MGLFSKSKKKSIEVESINNDFVAHEIIEKENINENLKSEMSKLNESSNSISNAVHDINSSLSSLTNATVTQTEVFQ